MKNETGAMGKKEAKESPGVMTLPWWTELFMAQVSGKHVHPAHSAHLHHCFDCACIVECHDPGCWNSHKRCAECCEKSMIGRMAAAIRSSFQHNDFCFESGIRKTPLL